MILFQTPIILRTDPATASRGGDAALAKTAADAGDAGGVQNNNNNDDDSINNKT